MRICWDYSHNNGIKLEESTYSKFVDYLNWNGCQFGTISQGLTWEKLDGYDILILGNPNSALFDPSEISGIVNFVKSGKSLMIFADAGGDQVGQTNLNALCPYFGFSFNDDVLIDLENNGGDAIRPAIHDFATHEICKGLHKVIYASGCTLSIQASQDPEAHAQGIAFGGITGRRKVFVADQWTETEAVNAPVAAKANYYQGRVFAIGNVSILSSLSPKYGWDAQDNSQLIQAAVAWLMQGASLAQAIVSEVVVPARIDKELWHWVLAAAKQRHWDVSTIFNYALKVLRAQSGK